MKKDGKLNDSKSSSNPVQQRLDQFLAQVTAPDARPADLLCDRHPTDAVAFTVVEADLRGRDITYGWLRTRSEQAAAALASLGVSEGDRVATLMGKSADLVVTLLGIWRLGAVHVPLFTAFAPRAISARLTRSAAKVVVCDASQRAKLHPSADMPDDAPWRIVIAGEPAAAGDGDAILAELLDAQHLGFPAPIRTDRNPLVQLFTSGTTGDPKAVPVPVKALAAFGVYMEYGLDVREDDVFWNAADPGWAYGLYYGILGPLFTGRRNLLLNAGFDAKLTWRLLAAYAVTNLAAAPTVYRALRSTGAHAPEDLALRACSSAGEPLNPELITWSERRLGVPIRDHYGQTELGMAIINGWHPDVRHDLQPGSMGRAMPGFRAAVLAKSKDDEAPAETLGRVAIDVPASPLMWFTGYADDPERTVARFSADGRWYFTGDVGTTDERGYIHFSSRDDDVIIMAGYRIGPFEVESALVSHPDVVEAAAIGVPDDLRGEVLEAYVVLRDGVQASPQLVNDLQQHVKRRYAAHAYPRSIHSIAELPKTPSGKVQRFILRELRRGQLQNAAQEADL
ncbi:acetyl-CoA synthetase [Melghirimyces profundicolus]|uniref:Acetyl-CoA synthetase n=1 Tax=Melghirimyces profundicolus TaxID=1242148 RepID=A0A2T6AZB8_9BACL|nr:AMP-binding protein [Melghirimyces profundicolus]PTX49159.1 acetyl-CoA synthetase [Melghirimyces profundicolus]